MSSSASALELALALSLCLEAAPMEKDYAVDFSTRRAHSAARIRSAGPGAVEVTVTLPGDGAPTSVTLTWQGVSLEAGSLKDRLAALKGAAPAGDHVLKLTQGGAEVATLSWSAAGETPELKAVREGLEQAAHVALVEATAFQQQGQSQIAKKAFESAGRSFLAGIESLGDLYRDPESLDDTGMKLGLGRSYLDKGDFEKAAAVLQRVLESRMDLYRRVRLKTPA